MASIGATDAKVTPIITGSRMPTPGKPTDWIRVAIPQANRSALIRMAICSRRQLQCPPDDQRHRHGAGIHHQHVLQAEREKARIWQNFVYWVYGL